MLVIRSSMGVRSGSPAKRLAAPPTRGSLLVHFFALVRRYVENEVAMITYLKGDATVPQAKGPKVIAHVCNDRGGWGKGFVLAISARWSEPEADYRAWANRGPDFRLGETRLVQVKPDTWVANMIAQWGYKTGSKGPPIRYEALLRCFQQLAPQAVARKASIHMPRIGIGLAGGTWSRIEPLIVGALANLSVYVYDFSG